MVGLKSQAESDLVAFEQAVRDWPLVRDCHMLNGEIDFVLRIVAPDLPSFQRFLTHDLTPFPNMESVTTRLVIRRSKREAGVPLDMIEPEDLSA